VVWWDRAAARIALTGHIDLAQSSSSRVVVCQRVSLIGSHLHLKGQTSPAAANAGYCLSRNCHNPLGHSVEI
jgi:hypothetical protein